MSVIFINPFRFAPAYDTDAQAYITAVEAADTAAGQSGGLETAVKDAINAFVVGCKADGIWNAIKASCILAGARTLTGALVPLVGTAPTNFNFVSGDYNRKTGLVGNGSTKYLDSNRASNADPQDSHHLSVYVSAAATTGSGADTRMYIGVGGNDAGATHIGSTFTGASTGIVARSRTVIASYTGAFGATGFIGNNRASSGSYTVRVASSNNSITAASGNRQSLATRVYATNWATTNLICNPRLAFYSIGESLDLALLDTRVTTLINAIAAAIP